MNQQEYQRGYDDGWHAAKSGFVRKYWEKYKDKPEKIEHLPLATINYNLKDKAIADMLIMLAGKITEIIDRLNQE